MDYLAPTTLDEAFGALAMEDARCLAGGQSLVAMMNLGLTAPSRLVSLRRIAALRGVVRQSDGGVRIGAMTTHAELAALDSNNANASLLAQAARLVAYPAVRAFGTIGGSVAHADPAADYPVVCVATNAQIEVASAKGVRRIPAGEFFLGIFETALVQGEIVTAIHLPAGEPGARAAYEKLSLVAGDFAILSVAAIVGATTRIAVGGCGPTPIRLHRLEDATSVDAVSDQRASAAYRRKVLPGLVRRTVERCKSN
jgi:aerobic carbon-monoxide dehydrogenase medium subunit